MVIEICDLRFICYLGFVIWNFINMDSKPRSKKLSIFVAILILLVGVIIGGYLVLKSGRGSASQLSDILSGASKTTTGCNPDPSDSNKDSDNDGLKDWQEMQIYKTDPCKPDSDGDGYLDGEEVASGYDPTKKAPGDELPGTASRTPRSLPQNLTEALKQKLSEQLNANKIQAFNESGDLLSSEELQAYPGIQETVQEVIASTGNLFAPDPIDENQIKTTPDNSRAAIQIYGASASKAFSLSESKSSSESAMFLNALQSNDFSELDLQLQNDKNTYAILKELTVPSELISLHKEQLEIISKLIKVYEAIKEIKTDPLKANLALQSYQIIKDQTVSWAKKMRAFIQAHP